MIVFLYSYSELKEETSKRQCDTNYSFNLIIELRSKENKESQDPRCETKC